MSVELSTFHRSLVGGRWPARGSAEFESSSLTTLLPLHLPDAPAQDFIANLGVSNPMDYKFYGICVSSCPAALDTVCNYELDTSVYNATIVDSCMNNVSYTPPSPLTCDKVSENCWVTPQKTSSLMFRCIPDYNVTNSEETTCSYPAGVTSANDPRCIIVTESKSGTVQVRILEYVNGVLRVSFAAPCSFHLTVCLTDFNTILDPDLAAPCQAQHAV